MLCVLLPWSVKNGKTVGLWKYDFGDSGFGEQVPSKKKKRNIINK